MPSRLILLVFLSTPSVRRATFDWSNGGYQLDISIHALREEGDGSRVGLPCKPQSISIHALREEGDRGHSSGCSLFCYFYPRPPRGGRPAAYSGPPSSMTFLSTPSARRATAGTAHCPDRRTISIHALREEGDGGVSTVDTFQKTFLSTPSARRATLPDEALEVIKNDFYPRPPRGGRRKVRILPQIAGDISIHALREEGDVLSPEFHTSRVLKFLSTPSARRATQGRTTRSVRGWNFYPRPPRGGRPESLTRMKQSGKISIHALREEGDGNDRYPYYPQEISIHALREEGDAD